MIVHLRRVFPVLLLAPAVLPLVYIGGIVYPYVVPKTLLLQSFGIAALSIFTYLALAGQPYFYGRLRTPATWIPAGLLLVAYVASFFGVGFYHSFWGLLERGDGLLTLTVITVFFYLILLSADRAFLERLAKIVAVVAGIVAVVAVLQWTTAVFGGKASFLPPTTGRIGSTLGNAAFLAGYLGTALFVILLVMRDPNGAWRRVYKIAAVLAVLAILFAATRGTILALLAALIVALAFAAWKGEGTAKRVAGYGLALLVVVAGFFFLFRTELAQVSFEPVRRLASISLSDGTVSSRLFVWTHIVQEAFQRPFSGYGAEHVAQLFDKVYDPSAISEQWFDRSHNTFLDYFAQYGVFGLALYLALIGAFAWYALKAYRREDYGPLNLGFLFLLLIGTYAVQNFFVFDTPSSLWLLYALFAFLIVLVSEAQATPLLSKRFPAVIAPFVSAGVAVLIVPTVILPLAASVFLYLGYQYHLTDVYTANAYFEKGLSLRTYADLEYGYEAYEMYTGRQATLLSGEDRVAGYEFSLSLLSANFRKYPYDARTATYLGHVLDTAPPEVTVDDAFDEQVLRRAIELSPLRAQPWYMLANISLRKVDNPTQNEADTVALYRKAISVLEEYARKEVTLPVPRYILASLYYKLGDTAAAKKWADEAYPLYTTPDLAAASPAVKYYLATEDWQRAVRFLADLAADDPTDYDVLYDLAKVTYLAGDPATALRIVEQLRETAPDILGTDPNFLAAITAYESR